LIGLKRNMPGLMRLRQQQQIKKNSGYIKTKKEISIKGVSFLRFLEQ
jgi:hypothetical protein